MNHEEGYASIQVRAGKESKFSIYISHILTVIIGFSALFCMTLIFSISASNYLIGLVLLYAVFFPVLILVRHSYTYFVLLPVPYLGSWVLSIVFLSSFAIPMLHGSILVSIVPAISATFIHLFSRMRSMIRTVPMMSASRSGAVFISALFFMVGTLILGPTPIQLDTPSKTIFYCSLLFAYTAFSMLYVNSAYRYRLICKVFKKNRIEPKLSEIWEKIRDKFSEREKDVDLLKYFFFKCITTF